MQNKIKELLSLNKTRKEICEILNISENRYKYLQSKYKLNSIVKNDTRYMNKEWLANAYKKYNGSATEIGKLCGVTAKVITYWRKKLDIPKSNMSNNAKKYDVNDKYFEVIDTEEKAYWLGFIMADGCVNVRTQNAKRLSISLAEKDKGHLEKFLNCIGSNHKIYEINSVCNFSGSDIKTCNVTINNANLCNDLIKHSVIPNKTGKECIPNSVPDSLVRHFIRGFFDGDGSISYYNNRNNYTFELCSTSETIMSSIAKFIKKNTGEEIEFKDYRDNQKYKDSFYKLKVMNIKTNVKIYNLLFNNATLFLDRKYKRVKAFLDKYSSPSQ